MYLCVQVSEVSTSVESYQLHVVGYDTTIITGCWFLHMIFKLGKLLIFYMWKKYTGITNQLHFLNSKYKQLGNNLMNFMKVFPWNYFLCINQSSSLQTKVKPHNYGVVFLPWYSFLLSSYKTHTDSPWNPPSLRNQSNK